MWRVTTGSTNFDDCSLQSFDAAATAYGPNKAYMPPSETMRVCKLSESASKAKSKETPRSMPIAQGDCANCSGDKSAQAADCVMLKSVLLAEMSVDHRPH
jgi:hypothetical protein